MRLLAPASVEEARADIDALRGLYAIELAVVDRRAAASADEAARVQIELGQRASDVFLRDKAIQLKSEEIVGQRAEISGMLRDLRGLETDNAALQIGLHDLTFQRDALDAKLADARSQIGSQEVIADKNLEVIASLNARISKLLSESIEARHNSEIAADRAQRAIAQLESDLEEARSNASTAAARLAGLEARHASLKSESEGRGAEALRLRERLAELEPRLASSETACETLALESSRYTAKVTERTTDLQRVLTLRREENDRLIERLAAAATRENELNVRVQKLAAARADTEGALRAARAENEIILQELGLVRNSRVLGATSTAWPSAHGDQLLRQAIIRLGRSLALGAGLREIADPDESEIAFNPRDLIVVSEADDSRSSNAGGRASEA